MMPVEHGIQNGKQPTIIATSIAVPSYTVSRDDVKALVAFMDDFAKRNG